MRPHLGEVERIVPVLADVSLGHDLHLHLPVGEVAPLDGIEQVLLRGLPRPPDDHGGLLVGPVLVALLRLEVELDEVALALRVDNREGVAAIAVHVPDGDGKAAVRSSGW